MAGSVQEALSTLEAPSGRVAIAVPDGTRSVQTVEALSALNEWLKAPAIVIVGLGLHRPMTDKELQPMRQATPWPVVNHVPDECVDLGEVQGIPCWVHPEIAAADHIITIGCVELHQYAGFSGGHKGVVVGCGGRATINALHSQAMTCHPAVEVGRLQGNPFREAVDSLGERIGTRLAIQWVAGHGWLAGDPRGILAEASRVLAPFYEHPSPEHSVLLRVPKTKAVNFYQASRAATYLGLSPAPPLHTGARLILDAACPEGLGTGSGELAFAKALHSVPAPWGDLLQGNAPDKGGVQRALMLARMAGRYSVIVAGCTNPEPLCSVGIEATSRTAEEIAGPDALVLETPFIKLPQLVSAE
ncbi:MAG: lactate racemase domain-containing protein [Myxococcota bacterium]|nr:lactate racemase domain-containing protein [Myxococcota bacterium]